MSGGDERAGADEAARVLVEPLERSVLDGVRELEGEAQRVRVDLGLIPVFADERPLQGLAGLMDWRSSGRLSALVRAGLCTGRYDERLLTVGERRLPMDRLVLVGLGEREAFDSARAREVAGRLVDIAVKLRARDVLIELPSEGIERERAEELFGAIIRAVEEALRSDAEPRDEPTLSRESEAPRQPAGPDEPSGPDDPEQPAESAELTEAPGAEAAQGSPSDRPEAQSVDEDASSSQAGEGSETQDVEDLPAAPTNFDAPRPPRRWWVVADERVVARLRRVLSGPPRPAGSEPRLHT